MLVPDLPATAGRRGGIGPGCALGGCRGRRLGGRGDRPGPRPGSGTARPTLGRAWRCQRPSRPPQRRTSASGCGAATGAGAPSRRRSDGAGPSPGPCPKPHRRARTRPRPAALHHRRPSRARSRRRPGRGRWRALRSGVQMTGPPPRWASSRGFRPGGLGAWPRGPSSRSAGVTSRRCWPRWPRVAASRSPSEPPAHLARPGQHRSRRREDRGPLGPGPSRLWPALQP